MLIKVNKRKPYVPDLLRPSEVQRVLSTLNIAWENKRKSTTGWIKIRSPFRVDRKPSFSLNIHKGCFKDFANDDVKGDIVQLVMLIKNCNRKEAEKWIINTLNLNQKIYLNL